MAGNQPNLQLRARIVQYLNAGATYQFIQNELDTFATVIATVAKLLKQDPDYLRDEVAALPTAGGNRPKAAVIRASPQPFIRPPSRAQLMAGSGRIARPLD